jgi:hypothetical protein
MLDAALLGVVVNLARSFVDDLFASAIRCRCRRAAASLSADDFCAQVKDGHVKASPC